jgi:hypothetical protein
MAIQPHREQAWGLFEKGSDPFSSHSKRTENPSLVAPQENFRAGLILPLPIPNCNHLQARNLRRRRRPLIARQIFLEILYRAMSVLGVVLPCISRGSEQEEG